MTHLKRTALVLVATISIGVLLAFFLGRRPLERLEANANETAEESAAHVKPLPQFRQSRLESAQIDSDAPSNSSQTFRHARECRSALFATDLYERQLAICKGDRKQFGKDGTSDWERSCGRKEAAYPARLKMAHATLSQCGPAESIMESYFYATEEAAREGDIEAQLCYADAIFDREGGWTDAEKLAHQEQAAQYINARLERGDWRMVGVLYEARYRPLDVPQLPPKILGFPTPSKLQTSRLLRLGLSNQEERKLLDAVSAGVGEEPSPRDMREAEEWAQRIYQTYFTKVDKLKSRPEACSLRHKEVL